MGRPRAVHANRDVGEIVGKVSILDLRSFSVLTFVG